LELPHSSEQVFDKPISEEGTLVAASEPIVEVQPPLRGRKSLLQFKNKIEIIVPDDDEEGDDLERAA
jgi:hypothetical protein